MKEPKPSAHLLYPNISSLSEQYINDKTLANNKPNNTINITKDMKNYYEIETKIYKKKLIRYNI